MSTARWVRLGRTPGGQYLVVIHTFARTDEAEIHIRIISAREADHREIRDYEQAPR